MDEPMAKAPNEFSEQDFWSKLKRYALAAGRPVVDTALQLFYSSRSKKTPAWAKTVIYGALAYFIWPADAVPDIIPVAGYTDDLGALAAALATVHLYITDDIRRQAAEKLRDWFGDNP